MLAWEHSDDYRMQYAETDDPRVLCVIEIQDDAHAPDGDAFAPAFWQGSYGRITEAGDTYQDHESERIAEAYRNVRSYAVNARYPSSFSTNNARHPERRVRVWYDPDEFSRRYLRIFHDADVAEVDSRGETVLLIDSPTWRAHVGIEGGPDADAHLAGDVSEWRDYLAGEVYGIGYATNPARVLDDAEIDLTDFDIEIEGWGFVGEDYAKQEAESFSYGEPDLPALLDLEGVSA